MQKTVVVGILATVVALGAWAGGPAEKATGEVGYEAFGLQRWAEFNAHEAVDDCTGGWNLVGDWVIDFEFPSHYVHDMFVESQSEGSFTGLGGYPSGSELYSHPWTVTGAVSGNVVTFTITYGEEAVNPGYQVFAEGIIAINGSMSGTCTTSSNQLCTWTTPSGSAIFDTDCTGKGQFRYDDANGDWYDADVVFVNVDGEYGYFGGPVTAASQPGWVGNWVSVAVFDGGEPAYLVDQIWGVFTTEGITAYNVANQVLPGPAFPITSGNLQTHTRD